MPRYVDVALPLPLEETFTYHVPPHLEEGAEPGMRAAVQFRRNTVTGVIVSTYTDADRQIDFKTKPVEDLPDPEPVFNTEMLELTKWVADYYLASWGEALKTALPQGIEQKSRWVVRPAGDPIASAEQLAGRAPAQARLFEIIADRGQVTLGQLRKLHPGGQHRAALRSLERDGHVEIVDEAPGPTAKPKMERVVQIVPHDREEQGRTLTAKQRRLIEGLEKAQRPVPLGLIVGSWGVSSDIVKRLEKRGLVTIDKEEVYREPDLGESETETLFTLTPDQDAALRTILPKLDAKAFSTVLCHGVTGSGKTRIYMDAIEHVINSGGGAIVLVPEISLTPQTTRRFKARFGDQVAVMHSQLSIGERYDAWRQVHSGDRRVVVGPRSAVFAPVKDLRLIVVDEEHDGSYKQGEHDPRYHARDVAVVRAQKSGAVVVLGSATPSLESLHNARMGKYIKVDLPVRVDDRPMPEVEIVDMGTEREAGNWSNLSRPLRKGIRESLDRGRQVVILQNRRGFSPMIQCQAKKCGYVFECPDCQVSMTYHQADNIIKCHYCGHMKGVPKKCPECGSEELKFGGTGTQKVEKHIEKAFPDVKIIRMDQDTTRRKNAHHKLLEQFRTGQAQILLGTQMVAKGLDFPNVSLVGVINADVGLSLPDFRASERTFQLLTQVAGRTGRGDEKGYVLIQTNQPDHPAVKFASSHDVNGFAEWETAERTESFTVWPPFSRMVVILLRGQSDERTMAAAEWLGGIATKEARDGVDVLGPVSAPIPRIRRFWRWHILLKGQNGRALRDLARLLRERHQKNTRISRGVQMSVDVDPVAVL